MHMEERRQKAAPCFGAATYRGAYGVGAATKLAPETA